MTYLVLYAIAGWFIFVKDIADTTQRIGLPVALFACVAYLIAWPLILIRNAR